MIGSLALYYLATGKPLIKLNLQDPGNLDHGHLQLIQEIVEDIPIEMIRSAYILLLKMRLQIFFHVRFLEVLKGMNHF